MSGDELRRRFLEFFSARGARLPDGQGPASGGGHKIVPSSSLIPDDPSVLLTTAGMQQFKPYFVGEPSPWGQNVTSVQKCFRTSDIDEVGDESHLTFFEMLGNFSFGGYGKKEAIEYGHQFITTELGLPIDYVTVFGGDGAVPPDEESEKIWRELGVRDIRRAGRADNFWGPTGAEGPCGPTTEIYVRGVEIWNIVFNQFYCQPDKSLEPLKTLGVDTGMGLERLAMVVQNTPTIFGTDLFKKTIDILPQEMPVKMKRILADHGRAISFLIADGVRPNNKGAGYVLRRLLRRLLAQAKIEELKLVINLAINKYGKLYQPELNEATVMGEIDNERRQFIAALELGTKVLSKLTEINPAAAFQLYESYGLPFEVIHDRFPQLRREDFDAEFQKHQEVSRAGATAKFAGGLADHEPQTIKLHTAHHLLLAALQRVLGPGVKQRGSNITQERLRLDFTYPEKLTEGQKRQVADLVNQKIAENLKVTRRQMPREEAEKLGAEREFGQKYGERVSVYFIEDEAGNVFSKEFCAGPHVARTGEIGGIRITKEEAVAAGIRRLRAVLKE